jgi:SpoVK/Ycf46/Vps4 family AAA+-type ATPase
LKFNFNLTALCSDVQILKSLDLSMIVSQLDAVDSAIRRPGRFDKHLSFGLPDEAGRKLILKARTETWKRDKPTDDFLSLLANSTAGFTGMKRN